MSLRDEMRKVLGGSVEYAKTDAGRFSNWWYRRLDGKTATRNGTYIGFMLDHVTNDEELELLWVKWNIERES